MVCDKISSMSEETAEQICGQCQRTLCNEPVCPACGWFDPAVDFAKDCQGDFWGGYEQYLNNHFLTIKEGLGKRDKELRQRVFVDPDSVSKTLQNYHIAAWSDRPLPNGETMQFTRAGDELKWTSKRGVEFRFSSDTIFTDFTNYDWQPKCWGMFHAILADKGEQEYLAEIKNYTKRFYHQIGGFIIFPRDGGNSINRVRAKYPINDRFDLALACIRIYYEQKQNGFKDEAVLANKPYAELYQVVKNNHNQEFFDLFGDFAGFVKFFCLQALVNKNCTKVKDLLHGGWLDEEKMTRTLNDPFAITPQEYWQWLKNQLAFVKKRTKAVNDAIKKIKN